MSDINVDVEVKEQVNVANKDAAPAQAPTLKNDAVDMGPAVVKPTDKNPDAAAKAKQNTSDPAKKKAKDGSLPKDQKPGSSVKEEAKPEDEKSKDKEVKAEDDDEKEDYNEVKKESTEVEIDLSDDVKALVSSDADLSEEFKDKAATIFETAVRTRIKEQTKILEAKYEEKLSTEKETIKEAMTEKVDSYLNYVVEEWMKENEIAVERGIRSELVEDFMTGLRNLFQEHYIDIPEEKVDLVDDLFGKVEELEGKLDEEINRSVDLKKELSEYKRDETIREVSDNLADTEKEKLSKLAEGIEYEDKEQFNEKLGVLKENYFQTNDAKAETTRDEEPVTNSEELNEEVVEPSMTHYVDALARFGQNS